MRSNFLIKTMYQDHFFLEGMLEQFPVICSPLMPSEQPLHLPSRIAEHATIILEIFIAHAMFILQHFCI